MQIILFTYASMTIYRLKSISCEFMSIIFKSIKFCLLKFHVYRWPQIFFMYQSFFKGFKTSSPLCKTLHSKSKFTYVMQNILLTILCVWLLNSTASCNLVSGAYSRLVKTSHTWMCQCVCVRERERDEALTLDEN
jgi:hypothetical protein